MKTKLQITSTVVTILSSSVLLTIYLAWVFYPLEIQYFELEKIVYLKAEDISYNFNILMNYLTNPFSWELDMPNFASSKEGLHHFQDVKLLFHLCQGLFLLSLPLSIDFFKEVIMKGYGTIYRRFYIWMALVPVLVALVGVLIGFDQFFVLFHQVLFPGDSTWLFNPATDPVIYILPAEFFLHCFLLFFFLYETLCLAILTFHFFQRKKFLKTG
ncbi:TIGR01906 family membrane protein [Streptococcus cameli]